MAQKKRVPTPTKTHSHPPLLPQSRPQRYQRHAIKTAQGDMAMTIEKLSCVYIDSRPHRDRLGLGGRLPCSRAAYPGSRCNPLACSVNTRRMYAQGCYPSPRRKSCMQTRLRQRGRKKRGLWGVYWRRGCEKRGAETEAKSRHGSEESKPRGPQASPSSYICKHPIPATSQNLGRIKGWWPVVCRLAVPWQAPPPL